MRVLQINSVCGVGSTGRIATDLYKVLEEHGHECLIAYGRGTAPEGINSYKIGTNLDNYLHVARTRLLDQHGYGSKKPTIELVKKIKEYNPDVIHLHNLHGYYLNLEVLFNYLAESNKPVVWTLHDCWAFTGHCAYFDYVGCDKWKSECDNCIQKKKYPTSFLLDKSQKNYLLKKNIFTSVKDMVIVSPSEWLSKLTSESFLSKYQIKIINNGIDLNVFKIKKTCFKDKNNLHDKIIILGVASYWEKRKGLDTFIELSKILDSKYQIVLIGISEKQKKYIPNNILTLSRTNNINELVEIYNAADVFLNPTLEDNFPTTNLESIACGTPVITYKTGGSPESINDDCGYVIEEENVYEIKRILELHEKEFKSFFYSNCIKNSFKYDKHKKYLEYIELYLRLLE